MPPSAIARARCVRRSRSCRATRGSTISRASRLVVRHESLAMSFGKALGIKHEIEVGEPSFDGLFLIEGNKEAALRMLSPNVRGLLMTLARFDVPTLEIDPPHRVAQLFWR